MPRATRRTASKKSAPVNTVEEEDDALSSGGSSGGDDFTPNAAPKKKARRPASSAAPGSDAPPDAAAAATAAAPANADPDAAPKRSKEERAKMRREALEWQPDTEVVEATAGPAGKRIMIRKIVYENFKSYAGVQEVGPFHKNFSAVVGPNGSGKSNVIDGLLFVSGKRAKCLRQSKVSELIHTSAEHPDVEHARVDVHFVEIVDRAPRDESDDDAYDIVEGSEIIVSRTAHRNNTSRYYVNGKPTVFSEVAKLLKRCGIDLDHNRFLILQGEVEQISMMKPKGYNPGEEGLLEYLEEVIGSHRFVEAIDDAAMELEALNEERTEKLNRVRFVEKEKDGLERSKNEAEAYVAAEVELRVHRGKLHQVFRRDALRHAEKGEARRAEIQEEIDGERAKLAGHDAEIAACEENVAEARAAHDEVAAQLAEAKDEFSEYERKDVKFREDLKHLKQREKRASDALTRERKKASEAQSSARAAAEDTGKHESAIDAAGKELAAEEAKLTKILDSLKGETAPLRDALEKKQQELVPRRGAADAARAEVDVARSEREMLASEIDASARELREAEASLAQCEASEKDATADMKAAAAEQRENEASVAAAEARLAELAPQEEKLTTDVRRLRAAVESARAAATEGSSRSRVLDAIDKARAAGKLQGVHGRLGDLGTIDPKYDVAVSTACPSLNNVVVETTADGQRCVEFLRRGGLGRATFIILEKLEYLRKNAGAQIETPRGAPRLFDLVEREDAKFDTAFYFALRDTLVADDLDTATAIALGGARRHRVVTLAGEVVDTSGTMAGGGGRVSRGLLGRRGAGGAGGDADKAGAGVEELAGGLDRALAALADLRREADNLRGQLSALTRARSACETRVSKLQMRLGSLSTQLPQLRQTVEDLRRAPKVDTSEQEARLKELDARMPELEAALAKAVGFTEDLEAECSALQQRIMDAGGVRLRAQNAKVDALRASIEEHRGEITRLAVRGTTGGKQADKSAKAVEKLEADLAEVRAKAEETRAEFEALTESAVAVMESYKRTEALLETRADELEARAQDLADLKKKSAKLRTREVELTNALDDVVRSVEEHTRKAAHWGAKVEEERAAIEDAVRIPGGGYIIPKIRGLNAPLSGEDGDADDDDDDDDEEEEEDQENEGEAGEKRLAKQRARLPEIPDLSEDDLLELSRDDVQYEITRLEAALAKLEPNVAAVVEYRRREKEWRERVADLDQITEARDAQRREHEALRKRRLDYFMDGFSQITLKLKELYQMITLGGDAELELVDSLDPFSEGITFSVRPPKKSWKEQSLLSGGERTLSSLSLIFALHAYSPSPVFFLDEIDAALDFRNVSVIASFIASKKNAQFIMISLRSQAFELADRLVGIYKTHNATKSVAINPKSFRVPPALAAQMRQQQQQQQEQALAAAPSHA